MVVDPYWAHMWVRGVCIGETGNIGSQRVLESGTKKSCKE